MGGLVCEMVVRSQLTFTEIPSEPSDVQLFDNQIRAIHFNTEYAQAVINETGLAEQVIAILTKPNHTWTLADRQVLLSAVNKVCEEYK